MRKIDTDILKGKENERLLKVTNEQLGKKMEIIADQDAQLILLKKTGSYKDSIIVNKSSQLKETERLLKKEHRRKNFTKIGWVTSVAILVTLFILKP